ncbi:hypothetical protein B484DRAFT_416359 [Ochromonadaceae sp. CCMP2298]|nr:hypothetical protein B484DRAFT_416359 [Ochromonadaceae sp. CCMP2298]
MSRYGKIGDVDNSEEIATGMVNIPATEKSYETFVRKFRGYVGLAENERVQEDALTDHNFANFLLAVGKEHDWKPHFRKASMAVNYLAERCPTYHGRWTGDVFCQIFVNF